MQGVLCTATPLCNSPLEDLPFTFFHSPFIFQICPFKPEKFCPPSIFSFSLKHFAIQNVPLHQKSQNNKIPPWRKIIPLQKSTLFSNFSAPSTKTYFPLEFWNTERCTEVLQRGVKQSSALCSKFLFSSGFYI